MTNAHTSDLKRDALTEETVEHYLQDHPDFFERHSGLLKALKIPHPRGQAISLVERQLEVLRARNRQLERKLIDLVQIARDNEALSSHLHRLALGLMEAEDLSGVIAITNDLLSAEFPSTRVVVKLFENPCTALQANAHLLADDDPAVGLFDSMFKMKRPICGLLADERVHCLFGGNAPDVASAVMIPLIDGRRLGVLALGSADKERFHAGMGTLFLGYLGELVSRAIMSHLTP